MLSLIEAIRGKANEIEAKRVVVDPMIALMLQYPSGSERRTAILDLIEFMSNLDATSLMTTELKSATLERVIRTEEFLAQGVIVLHTFVDNKEIVRGIQIEKMRGINHDNQIRPYKITENGIEVFAEEQSLVGFNKIVASQPEH
jgi:KaiC/GvpD/RAD55 family RecA-like ATPase